MTRRHLLAATVIALGLAIVPVTRDTNSAIGLGLSTASCATGDCGHPTMLDCFCPDLYIPNHIPRCDDD